MSPRGAPALIARSDLDARRHSAGGGSASMAGRFRLLLFLWPSDLPFPSQVAHALSIIFLSIEHV